MKKYFTYLTSLIIAVFFTSSLFVSGCDTTESTPPGDENPTTTKPATPQVTLNGPNTTSTDPYVYMVNSYAQLFTGISMQFAPLQNITGNQNGNVWSYEITLQGITTKYQCVKNSDGSVLWSITWNGTNGSKT
ncbi:MAG: hypothetical protein HYV29_05995 [Ignavibacteriales bacterium]|nr:hypothetical protein [Ignavibacteriales bacterium]